MKRPFQSDPNVRVAPASRRERQGYWWLAAVGVEERDREHVHLILVTSPEGLSVRTGTECCEAGDICPVHDLDVCEVVAPTVVPVRADRGLDRVESVPHRTITKGVEVDLETGCRRAG